MELFIIGGISGFTSGLLGAGGGVLMIPALYFFTDFTYKEISALAIGCMIPALIMAFLRHPERASHGLESYVFIALGAFLGALAGATLIPYVSGKMLSRIFGVLLLVVAVRFIVSPKDPSSETEDEKEVSVAEQVSQ